MTEFIACVLIVEDKDALQHLLRTSLTVTEYADLALTTGQETPATMAAGRAALVALEMSFAKGMKLTRQPQASSQIPVMLFAMPENGPLQIGTVDAGDGDHLHEARHVEEDDPRLRKANLAIDDGVLRVRDLMVDRARRIVTLGKEEIHLTPTEYELLCLLAAQAGAVLPHEQLLQELWGAISAHTVHLLRVNISNLRRKLDADPTARRYITTEPGIGYRFRLD